ncbi:uncharacterized protein LOC117567330 [Drosophila albomicans]|uniref:Uncharacterized protein LOC117567330 n=1 Tax=Drosophila albomicans TaxID=7291 RepID=A0A6P8WUQ6_DROAB|nr:uncharacterized protein LOC117567330 [Drosophila albomicans]
MAAIRFSSFFTWLALALLALSVTSTFATPFDDRRFNRRPQPNGAPLRIPGTPPFNPNGK